MLKNKGIGYFRFAVRPWLDFFAVSELEGGSEVEGRAGFFGAGKASLSTGVPLVIA